MRGLGLGLGLGLGAAAGSGVSAPANTVAPAITGTPQVGETLTCSTGTWTGSPTSYAYQWEADAVNIGGATASTYLLTAGEVGKVITVTVTATNAGGSTPATSAATAAVAALFDPASLFLLGEKGGWWEPAPANCFQLSNGTTACAVGDPVGYLTDLSGNGLHLIQATAGQRPILRHDGTNYYLELDLTDDFLGVAFASGIFTTAMDFLSGMQRQAGTFVPFVNSYSGLLYCMVGQDGSASSPSDGSGTPTYKVSGVAVPGGTGATRNDVHDAWATGTNVLAEAIDVNCDDPVTRWLGFGLGEYATIANLTRIYATIAHPTLSAGDLTDARTYFGAKAGLTLGLLGMLTFAGQALTYGGSALTFGV